MKPEMNHCLEPSKCNGMESGECKGCRYRKTMEHKYALLLDVARAAAEHRSERQRMDDILSRIAVGDEDAYYEHEPQAKKIEKTGVALDAALSRAKDAGIVLNDPNA